MCQTCADRGYTPTAFGTLVPCPACARPVAFAAYCGTEFVEAGDALRPLLALLTLHWESCGEDVVVWARRPDHGWTVAAVLQDHRDGRPRVLTF